MRAHADRKHALLSASGASRWLNCTPSARLEEANGKRESSVYAQEGTLAHELSELYIRRDALDNITSKAFDNELEKIMSNELFSEEMLDMVPRYVDYCIDTYNEAKANGDAILEIEQKLDLTEWVPESFGTADCVILADNIMEVIDLKYGKGVPVYAEWNSQLMLYALGALRKYDTIYDISLVRITVVQPRLDNINSFDISVEELLKWAEEELKVKAKMAYAGEGELNCGDWCKFCAVKNRCRALYDEQLKIAKYEFSGPDLLTDDEIADVVKRLPKLVDWANSIHEYAQTLALNGKAWPGMKLVEGVARRKWIEDEQAIEKALKDACLGDDEIYDVKLKSITQIEKLVGKKNFEASFSNLVIKPQGKPTLVPESDKRPEIGLQQAINDFK